ncbi:sorbosone dehydrogenase family protein [Nocardiopsis sp. CNT312]|uniref:PQQ-dependent sugar dehydrogenase n=1 Tax=Nocardiopsis sp. CNT312 TaxID=1137268 RepID=UPI0004914D1D|nr:PQQ-dependent sugar dehydrogenase [Nocardiopsis sp. CNT312]
MDTSRPRRGRRRARAAALAALSLALCSCSPLATDAADPAEEGPGAPEAVATGLDVPWGMDFLPDGSALVTQRDTAEVVRVASDGTTTGAGTVEGVVPGGEGGLMGLAVDPHYPADPFVYVYYTAESDNRVARIGYDAATGSLGAAEVILDGIPKAGNHNGGRIAFGPDGLLYVATGDAGQGALAQDTGSLAGKILRVTDDGAPAEGNPFGDEVYSYGHRNVQGLAWDGDGRLYATEFGQNTLDEVNLIEPGNNYGWPEVEGPGGGDAFTDPLLTWTPEEASPSGAAVAGGALWVAALRGERLWRVPLDGGTGTPRAHLVGEYGRLRTVAATADGEDLWVATSERDGRGSPEEGDDRVLRVPVLP